MRDRRRIHRDLHSHDLCWWADGQRCKDAYTFVSLPARHLSLVVTSQMLSNAAWEESVLTAAAYQDRVNRVEMAKVYSCTAGIESARVDARQEAKEKA